MGWDNKEANRYKGPDVISIETTLHYTGWDLDWDWTNNINWDTAGQGRAASEALWCNLFLPYLIFIINVDVEVKVSAERNLDIRSCTLPYLVSDER